MANRNIGIGIGIGVAGIIGYAAARLILGAKKKQVEEKNNGGKNPVKSAEPDAPPKDITCPACGAQVREYEFFCPACRRPMETATAGEKSNGAENK